MLGMKTRNIAVITFVAAVLGIILMVCAFRKSYIYDPSPEEVVEHYSAAVKFITAPLDLQTAIIKSANGERKQPVQTLIRNILSDTTWGENEKSARVKENLMGLHRLVGVERSAHSNPFFDIINNLAERIDSERNQNDAIFKCVLTATLYSNKMFSMRFSEIAERASLEAVLDKNGDTNLNESLDKIFNKLEEKVMKKHVPGLDRISITYDFKAGAIFSFKNKEGCKNQSIFINLFFPPTYDENKTYRLHAILYLDQTDSEKGIYKVDVYKDEDEFNRKFRNYLRGRKIQILHYLYTPGRLKCS
ncbi:hypothetical protein ENBRE01_1861 [Enteropsectra breve]|nr:hypothetical protein ENBRE01_1861 [Enteropsectra breve]